MATSSKTQTAAKAEELNEQEPAAAVKRPTEKQVKEALTEEQKEQVEALTEKGIKKLFFSLKENKVEWYASEAHAKQATKGAYVGLSTQL
ncbi:hypothetical protein V6R21_20275 [Limibacter armeniacum]|uniref:hypothetical protein n=1 Tax=Limibacter armeniacum TaxID=466084 RepID=UPI002FE598A1